jgi:hypothetical protein
LSNARQPNICRGRLALVARRTPRPCTSRNDRSAPSEGSGVGCPRGLRAGVRRCTARPSTHADSLHRHPTTLDSPPATKVCSYDGERTRRRSRRPRPSPPTAVTRHHPRLSPPSTSHRCPSNDGPYDVMTCACGKHRGEARSAGRSQRPPVAELLRMSLHHRRRNEPPPGPAAGVCTPLQGRQRVSRQGACGRWRAGGHVEVEPARAVHGREVKQSLSQYAPAATRLARRPPPPPPDLGDERAAL